MRIFQYNIFNILVYLNMLRPIEIYTNISMLINVLFLIFLSTIITAGVTWVIEQEIN
jgi:hypothetical protein